VELPNAPPTPTPYRDQGKPLAELIPPDRRAQRTVGLVLASMLAGALLWQLGGFALEVLKSRGSATRPSIVSRPVTLTGRVPPSTLHGPGGDTALPPRVRSVINVWLQGCQDCMPAFAAMGALERRGGYGRGVPVINVAYGEADPAWAEEHAVSTNLVFDPGGASVVRPLGISSFTTLVVDPDGSVVHVDRPDRPGYRERVRAALALEGGDPGATTDDAPPLPGDPLHTLDASAVERVVAAHRAALRRRCWDAVPQPRPRRVAAALQMTIDPRGAVSEVSSTGDPGLGACLEGEARAWRFPPPASSTKVNVPFSFETQ
jgi:hypothetical protein